MSILTYLILGLLTSLLFPPYFFLPLGFIIFPYFCFLLESNRDSNNYKENYKNFLSFGFGFFLSFLFWIKNPFFVFEETKNYFLLFLLLIFFLSLILALVFVIILKLSRKIPLIFLVPLMFTTSEYIISILFYGFPWFTFSLVISGVEYYLYILSLFGTLVSSYLIIQIFCLPYLLFSKKYYLTKLKYLIILYILPVASVFIFIYINSFKTENIDNSRINIEIFQLNFKNNIQDLNYEKRLKLIIRLIEESNANLIIFGENNFPYLLNNLNLKFIKDILKERQTVIIGATRIEKNKYYNSLINITKNDVSYFDKKILVPFGEFLPLRNTLKFFERIVGPNNYSKGNEKRLINVQNKFSYLPTICYEIVFYWKLLNKFNYKANFIVNITNDNWFGKYLGPYQHLYLTKIRAAEFKKPIIRVSNNGISAIIDKNGKVLNNTNLNKVETLSHTLYIEKNVSLYNFHLILKIYFFITYISIILYLRKNAK